MCVCGLGFATFRRNDFCWEHLYHLGLAMVFSFCIEIGIVVKPQKMYRPQELDCGYTDALRHYASMQLGSLQTLTAWAYLSLLSLRDAHRPKPRIIACVGDKRYTSCRLCRKPQTCLTSVGPACVLIQVYWTRTGPVYWKGAGPVNWTGIGVVYWTSIAPVYWTSIGPVYSTNIGPVYWTNTDPVHWTSTGPVYCTSTGPVCWISTGPVYWTSTVWDGLICACGGSIADFFGEPG